jgi:uncharacterized membrane protein
MDSSRLFRRIIAFALSFFITGIIVEILHVSFWSIHYWLIWLGLGSLLDIIFMGILGLYEQETAKQIQKPLHGDISISREDPFEILRIRYAKGEITKEEYQDMMQELEKSWHRIVALK